MQRRRRQSLADLLLVWGFVGAFAGLMGAGCFEAYKIVAVLPAAFESTSTVWRNPMRASDEEYEMNQDRRTRMTPQERAQYREWAEQQRR